MPLNRMEDIRRRESVELPRATICTWHATLADVASGWWARCVATRSSRLVRRRDRRARAAKEEVPPLALLGARRAEASRALAVDTVLAEYEGYLVADAHSEHDHRFEDGHVIEVSCWAHCRR